MILHHIQRFNENSDCFSEGLMSKVAMLICEQFIMENAVAYHLISHKMLFTTISDDQFLLVQLKMLTPGTEQYKVVSHMYQVMQMHKQHKLQTKETLVAFQKMKRQLAAFKEKYKQQFENIIEEHKLWPLQPFLDFQRGYPDMPKASKERGHHEDPYIEFLKSLFATADNIMLINMNDFNATGNWQSFKDKDNMEQLPGYLDCLLYRFPDITQLTYEQLSFTRNNILQKVKECNVQLFDLHNQVSDLEYDARDWEKLRNMMNNKLAGAENLQAIIDQEIHIEQARQSGLKKSIEVSVGVTSVESMAAFYQGSGLLEPYVAATLRDRLDKAGILNRCCLYFNMRIVEE